MDCGGWRRLEKLLCQQVSDNSHQKSQNNLFNDRFVDWDMLLRYHWGLAVGHVYTHGRQNDEAGVNFSHGRGWRNLTSYTDSAPSDEESPAEDSVEHTDDEEQGEDWQSSTGEEDSSNSSGSDSDESSFDSGCGFEFSDL